MPYSQSFFNVFTERTASKVEIAVIYILLMHSSTLFSVYQSVKKL